MTGLDKGTYELSATYTLDGFAQTATPKELSIAQPAMPMSITFATVAAQCGLPNSGKATISVSGGWGTQLKSYSLDGSAPADLSPNPLLIKNLSVGTHTVVISLPDGSCPTSGTFEITEQQLTLSTTSISHPSCDGANDGSINLTSNLTGITYQKIGGSSNTSGFFEDLAEVRVGFTASQTSTATCKSDTLWIDFIAPEPLLLTTSAVAADCGQTNGLATVQITGGTAPYDTLWVTAAGVTVNPERLAGGSYLVKVTDAQSCEATGTVEILDNPGISIASINLLPATCEATDGSVGF